MWALIRGQKRINEATQQLKATEQIGEYIVMVLPETLFQIYKYIILSLWFYRSTTAIPMAKYSINSNCKIKQQFQWQNKTAIPMV